MLKNLKSLYNEYPRSYKVLVLATFIDRLGGFLLYPFFAAYVKQHFSVGMTQVGFLFSIFSFGNIFGNFIGGAMTDKYGRKTMLLFGLIISGTSSILMGFVNKLEIFYVLALFMGFFGAAGGPAQQAMVADLLPKEKQTEGFGILRIAINLSATFGPIFGGFLAKQGYMILFIGDAISSLITAIIVFIVIPETKPENFETEKSTSIGQTMAGYFEVAKDGLFVVYILISMLMTLVYMQMNSTLSVYLLDIHGFSLASFGFLLSMNAGMVVLFQFWISRLVSKYDLMKMMALGTILYAIGFGLYAFILSVPMFFVAMAIITIGEMIVSPIGQSLVAKFAPTDKRGRYMAAYGFSWVVPSLFGVVGAGLIWDHVGPSWVWIIAGILGFMASVGYFLLDELVQKRFDPKGVDLSKKSPKISEKDESEIQNPPESS